MKRPKLRDDLVIVVQQYRGDETYIVKDPSTHKYYRFKPLEVFIMQQFEGAQTIVQLANGLAEHGVPVTAAVLEKFARRLAAMGLLERTLAEQSTLLLERLRAERHRRVRGTHYEGSLLRMRWSVGDPNKVFDRWMPALEWFFTPTFLAISVAMFVAYLLVFVTRWPDLRAGILAMYSTDFYTLQNIVVFWGTAMVVIAIHELGHGVTCKHFGGQVHEMGAMLLYFQPAFYCNVNDAWTFSNLSHRLWVTAAGSWIQLVIAGGAALVWVVVDPASLVSRIAFFAVLVGGATTVLANANPLIPLDGYYALSDYLEIPNLRQRALGYVSWLIKRYVIRLNVPEPSFDDPRERRALIVYGALSVLYVGLVLALIAVVVAGWAGRAFGAVGVLAFAVVLWILLRHGLRDWGRAVLTSLREHRDRLLSRRTVRWAGGGAVVLLLVGLLVPAPIVVRGPFVASPAYATGLDAASDGVLTEVLVAEGARVGPGTPVARLRNFAVERDAVRLARALDSLEVVLRRARVAGRSESLRRVELARDQVAGRLAAVRERAARLTLRAPTAGVLLTPRPREAVGRWYEAGETVFALASDGPPVVRVALHRAGAVLVDAGQTATVQPHALGYRAVPARVASVSSAAREVDGVEARLRLERGGSGMLLGMTGEAKITVRRSNVLGALWWGIRARLRSDLLL